jgi:hypothetical protein
MRRWVVLSVASGLLLALPAAAQHGYAAQRAAGDPIDTLFVKLGRGIPLESDIELDPAKSYTFEVSGEGKSTVVYQGKKSVDLFDALYCYSSAGVRQPCGGKSGDDAPLFFKATEGSTQRVWISSFEYFLGEKKRGAIPASSSHIYRGVVRGWDGTFEAYSNPNICSGSSKEVKITCEGGFTIKVFGAEAKEPKLPLVVYFKAGALGKPNLEVSKAKGPAPVKSEFTVTGPDEVDNEKGWAHATFTRRWRNTKLLLANETKGQVVHRDVYADGTEKKLVLGLVTPPEWLRKLRLDRAPETLYSPATRRLAVLLRVKDSDDDRCPAGSLLFGVPERFVLLTLVPVGGIRDTATFTGFIAASKEAGPCPGHAHGWENKGSTRVRVRVRTGKPKPK